MRKLAIIVGHTKRAQGAGSHRNLGMSEYAYNMRVAELIQNYAKGVDVRVFLRDYVGIAGAYEKVKHFGPDAAIELHFNAFNGEVQGTEVLWNEDKDSAPEKDLANKMLEKLYELFGRKGSGKRGKKELSRGERGWYNVSRVSSFPSILIEPFFGDNPDDAMMGQEKMKEYAQAIVDCFKAWCGEKPEYVNETHEMLEDGKPEYPQAPWVPFSQSTQQEPKKKKKKRGRPKKKRG